MTPFERWLKKVKAIAIHGCWEWQGWKRGGNRGWDDGGPYGGFRVNGKKTYAHRFAYEHFFGPIPKGLVLHHRCLNRLCVNPFHLLPVTVQQNTALSNEDLEEARREDLGGFF